METLSDMAFDYAMQRGHGKKAHENFVAGAKAVLREIKEAYDISGIDTMVDRLNSFYEELRERRL